MSSLHHPANLGQTDSQGVSFNDLSPYEIAVLATLLDQEDANKVMDLAAHWGYQKEFLHSIWQQLHSQIPGEQGDRTSKLMP